jgi:hypothetical protein
MILGLIYGRDRSHLSDWHIYKRSMVPAGEFCRAFEQEFGSTMCHDIQKVKFGRCFDLSDPDELRAFQEAGATRHCSAVVRSAVRIAAEILLDDANKLQ